MRATVFGDDLAWPSWLTVCISLLMALPFSLAFSPAPSPTFFNEITSFGTWAIWLLAWALVGAHAKPVLTPPLLASLGALGLLFLCAVAAPIPATMRVPSVLALGMSAAVLVVMASAAQQGNSRRVAMPIALGIVVAGVLNTIVGAAQVFLPETGDGWLVARTMHLGRAIGNLRQPNQLSTLLLLAMTLSVWLASERRWRLVPLGALLALLTFGVALTASRTGALGIALFAVWSLVDRRVLPRRRLLLAVVPLSYLIFWSALSYWGSLEGNVFFGAAQLDKSLGQDPTTQRAAIWTATWSLIEQHPWGGVGFGAFNFAWSMTPNVHRGPEFVGHTHNAVLHLAVELGIPLALLVLGLCMSAAWSGRAALTQQAPERRSAARIALFALCLVATHSMLEYPLWHAHFLLPTAAIAGWYIGMRPDVARAAMASPRMQSALVVGATLVAAGCVWTTAEYLRIAQIFDPYFASVSRTPIEQRVERGLRSPLLGHYAEYAVATDPDNPSPPLQAFERPLSQLVDAKLLIAYANALARRGDVERARHVAARLREFKRPEVAAFFAVCKSQPTAYQCGPDPRLPYQALRP